MCICVNNERNKFRRCQRVKVLRKNIFHFNKVQESVLSVHNMTSCFPWSQRMEPFFFLSPGISQMCSWSCLDLDLSHFLHRGKNLRGGSESHRSHTKFMIFAEASVWPACFPSTAPSNRWSEFSPASFEVTGCRVWWGWAPRQTPWGSPSTRISRRRGWRRSAEARTARRSPRSSAVRRSRGRRGWGRRRPWSQPARGRRRWPSPPPWPGRVSRTASGGLTGASLSGKVLPCHVDRSFSRLTFPS